VPEPGPPEITELDPSGSEPGKVIKIKGFYFGDVQGESVVHIGGKTYDSSAPRIKLWSDNKIKIRIPDYGCDWFRGQDYRKRKVWVTVDGEDSNVRKLRVLRPDVCLAADFSATPTSGSTPLDVTFTDLSTGTIDTWEWDFDNDTLVDSTMRNPTYTYDTQGTYTVTLRVSGPEDSDSKTKADYITVTAP
jgi:PKD repeat protein